MLPMFHSNRRQNDPTFVLAFSWRLILALSIGMVLWPGGTALAESDPARLVNIRGERAGAVAGFFLAFDRPVAAPRIHSEDGRFRVRLADVTTALAPVRAYRNFEATLRLAPEGSNLDVLIEVARATGPPFVDVLHNPEQLVVYQPLKLDEKAGGDATGPVRLVDLEGVRYARSAAVILTFSGPFEFIAPAAEDRTIRLGLPQITSQLKAFRRYSSFGGWLNLEAANEGLVAAMALPEGFETFDWQRLTQPERLMIRFLPEASEAALPPAPAAAAPAKSRLVSLTGALQAGSAVIELTFSAPFESGPVRTDLESLRVQIPNAESDLAPLHQYPQFKSSVGLQAENGGIEIAVGKPPGFEEPLIETLNDPPRLRISFPPSQP